MPRISSLLFTAFAFTLLASNQASSVAAAAKPGVETGCTLDPNGSPGGFGIQAATGPDHLDTGCTLDPDGCAR